MRQAPVAPIRRADAQLRLHDRPDQRRLGVLSTELSILNLKYSPMERGACHYFLLSADFSMLLIFSRPNNDSPVFATWGSLDHRLREAAPLFLIWLR
ncbi:uncharacterized protein LOC113188834 isoform X2 [Urocitellus parryii]